MTERSVIVTRYAEVYVDGDRKNYSELVSQMLAMIPVQDRVRAVELFQIETHRLMREQNEKNKRNSKE